jgi:hypothetical protein
MIWAECSKTVPNAAARGQGRVEMHRDAGGVRRQVAVHPRACNVNQSFEPGSIGEIVAFVSEVGPMGIHMRKIIRNYHKWQTSRKWQTRS